MTEWGVVGVIIALVGLVAGIVKPITNLTQSITKLTVVVDRLENDMQRQRQSAKENHKRLWEENVRLDAMLDDHEHRITVLEEHGVGGVS